ncbi:hypothetical protein GE061_004489 [Apolygus lucorum]|uniref:Lipase n=1 Tax=Apolygus lucorum TaxID=248454 RepID=A0A6A4IUC0_APOLU|nr:hypothetical protein GE061_004489 [Apolygus lucorum]
MKISTQPVTVFLACFQLSWGFSVHNTTELLANMMLFSEEHTYTTEDGYILRMFRIPKIGATPVLFVHGFLGSSDLWLLTNRRNNMPTIFYDEGYDVWLMNQRGNVYSKRHVMLSSDPGNAEFWNFSFHEIGLFDLAATIDHILESTKSDSLLYVGHSMATAALMVLCSQRPEYNRKIRGAVLLAPVAYSMGQSKLPFITLVVNQASFFANIMYKAHTYEFLPFDETRIKLTYTLCASQVSMCSLILKILFRTNIKNLVRDEIPIYLSRLSSGTSVKNYEHLGNIVSPGNNFTMYNYGPAKNQLMYGSPCPPQYNVGSVTVPLALFYSKQDPFLDSHSVAKLKANAPNVILDLRVSDPDFQHLDYLFGINSRPMVTDSILKLIRQMESGVDFRRNIVAKRSPKLGRRTFLYRLRKVIVQNL